MNDQTVEKEYKPSIRFIQNKNALQESSNTVEQTTRTHIKVFVDKSTTKETDEQKDMQKKIEAFKSRNKYGHASDSQAQNHIYNWDTFKPSNKSKQTDKQKGDQDEDENYIDMDQRIREQNFLKFTNKDNRVDLINFDEIIIPYETNFNEYFNLPIYENLLSQNNQKSIQANLNKLSECKDDLIFYDTELFIENECKDNGKQLYSYNYIEIDEILNRILFKPIQLQFEIVNKSLINYFLVELKLEEHLSALRKYLLFENGEFAQTFVDQLSDYLFTLNLFKKSDDLANIDFKSFLSPIYISEALDKAVSQIKNCKYIENLSIRIIDPNATFSGSKQTNRNISTFLSCFELKYKLDWPLNIIISETCLKFYNQVFSFLLQIKFVLTALNNCWHTLKRYGKPQTIFFIFYISILFFVFLKS